MRRAQRVCNCGLCCKSCRGNARLLRVRAAANVVAMRRGVVVAMRRDCCACVRLRTSWRCRGTSWQCGETAATRACGCGQESGTALRLLLRCVAMRSVDLMRLIRRGVDSTPPFISPTLPVIACTLLSRLVGRCGHICCFRIDFACALPGPL